MAPELSGHHQEESSLALTLGLHETTSATEKNMSLYYDMLHEHSPKWQLEFQKKKAVLGNKIIIIKAIICFLLYNITLTYSLYFVIIGVSF